MDSLLDLPFDQYQRYRMVADLVAPLAAARPRMRVLEVGGRTALLRSFLPEARVELVDLEASDAAGLVLGDGSRLPFRSGSFDLVAACDTLEHVPPARRDEFVRECCRVSRGWIVLAGPFAAPDVDAAEELLQGFLRDKLGIEHRYLEEHRALGLPDRGRTEALLAERAERVTSVGHGNLGRWQALLTASMYLDSDPELRGLARAYYRFYNAELYASDHLEPVYRYAVVAALAGSPQPEGGPPRGATPAQALAPFGALLDELTAFDRRRRIYEREAQDLRATIADLEQDLAGHRGRLEATSALLQAETGERASLTRLLLEEQRAHVELGKQYSAVRSERDELQERLRQGKAHAANVERNLREDLACHASSLENLEQQRRGAQEQLVLHRREIVAQQQETAALRGLMEELTLELESRVAHQHDLESRLEQVNALAIEVNEALRRAHWENLQLQAELRSRAKSLLRVLAPRKRVS